MRPRRRGRRGRAGGCRGGRRSRVRVAIAATKWMLCSHRHPSRRYACEPEMEALGSMGPALPRVEMESSLSAPGGTLYHRVAHEVGHLLDREHGAGPPSRPANKPSEPGEFG